MAERRLTRSRTKGTIAGVCAGLSDYFDVDVVLVRAAWIAFSIVPGAIIGGVLAYLAAWMVMPESTAEATFTRRQLTRSTTNRKVAGVCGGLAEYFEIDATMIRLVWLVVSIVFGAIIGGVIAYLIAWMIIPRGAASAVSTAASISPV